MLPDGATLAPVILATDKTQLTQFSGGKSAYPIYLTLGNIPKAIRRKPSLHPCVLLGYLSVDKVSRASLTRQEQRARTQRLFHESMRVILEPLVDAGRTGIEMTGGDGAVRRVYPILAAYVADYPEQCLVACSKYGVCPKCRTPSDQLGMPTAGDVRTPEWTERIIEEAGTHTMGSSHVKFHQYCMENGVSGSVHRPFWSDLPHANIHDAITPDVLHQLYQGVLKHLVSWCQRIMTPQELDHRIRTLPPAYGVRHFKNGISALSQISGSERKHMAKILLGCLIGAIPNRGVRACRALLDFIYLAQYPTHDTSTLGYLEDALQTFHRYKTYFIDTGVRDHLHIPKFHSLLHYARSIKLLGTSDNYNTEMFERLHIDFAKEGWRATNRKNEFPQMVTWLSRQEKMYTYRNYITWKHASIELPQRRSFHQPPSLPKHPSQPHKHISLIQTQHHAPNFSLHLKEYLNALLRTRTSNRNANLHALPFDYLDVYHTFKFQPSSLHDDEEEADSIKALPGSATQEPRFDTVVVLHHDSAQSTGLEGMLKCLCISNVIQRKLTAIVGTRIGRLRVIFRLPQTTLAGPSPAIWPRNALAYVEWYTPLKRTAESDHNMYSIRIQRRDDGTPAGSVIPLSSIRQSCMLFPVYGRSVPIAWTSNTVLDQCSSFLVNNWSSMYAYQTIW